MGRLQLTVVSLLTALATLVIVADRAAGPVRGGEQPIAFTQGTLDISDPGFITAMTFGPDGRLYVADLTGIYALTLDDTGTTVISRHDIVTGLQAVLGLAFDPAVPSSYVYASRLDPDATPGFRSIISRFNIYNGLRRDVITGLPDWVSFEHFTDGIAFDSSGNLYIGQGAGTDSGGNDSPLAGALLVADVTAPSFDGAITYKTSGGYVNQTGGDVHVFAPGLRNPYGVIVHSNGYIYATDNGGGASPQDEIDLIEEGNYYGHSNLNRGRSDPRQMVFHAATDPGTDDYTPPIYTVNDAYDCRLCESLAEYTGEAFGGAMTGDLVLDSLFGGVWRAHLSSDGRQVLSVTEIASFTGALGIAVGPTGIIYLGAYIGPAGTGHRAIAYLEPSETAVPSPTPTWTSTLTVTSSPTTTHTPTPVPQSGGDVDCSGATDSRDAALILQFSAELLGSLPCAQNGDISGDGAVNSRDALLVLQCAAGLTECA